MSAWKFRKKTITNNVVSRSSGSGDQCYGSSGVRGLTDTIYLIDHLIGM